MKQKVRENLNKIATIALNSVIISRRGMFVGVIGAAICIIAGFGATVGVVVFSASFVVHGIYSIIAEKRVTDLIQRAFLLQTEMQRLHQMYPDVFTTEYLEALDVDIPDELPESVAEYLRGIAEGTLNVDGLPVSDTQGAVHDESED